MKKTYLVLAFLITSFLLAGDAYGEEEVYYCVEIDRNGFSYDKKNETYLRRSFKESKFKVKLYRTSNQIEMSHDDFGKLNFNCRIPFFGELNTLACHPTGGYLVNFNLDIATGRFTLSHSGGYVTGDGGSLSVSYGKCDKF